MRRHLEFFKVVILVSLLSWVRAASGQLVSVTAEVNICQWSDGPREDPRTIHVLVGTNFWQMSDDYCGNCEQTAWFTNDQIITHTRITKLIIPDGVELSESEKARLLQEEPIRVYHCPGGNPSLPRGVGEPDRLELLARIGWLAFCSGPYLQREGRELYPPSDLWKQLIRGNRFSDRTTAFSDGFGLPRVMNLYSTDGQPTLEYRALSSTNILDREFPLEFKLVQYRPAPLPGRPGIVVGTNGWTLELMVSGRVTGIGIAPQPEIPAKVMSAIRK